MDSSGRTISITFERSKDGQVLLSTIPLHSSDVLQITCGSSGLESKCIPSQMRRSTMPVWLMVSSGMLKPYQKQASHTTQPEPLRYVLAGAMLEWLENT